MYILQQKIKGPASPNALLHSLPSRGFHRGQARLKPPTPKCIKMLVCICIFLGKDSSAVTHSWKSLPSQNLEELQSFSSPRGEDISYPPPQQLAVGGGGQCLIPTRLQIHEPKITGHRMSVPPGSWRPHPATYFAGEKTEAQQAGGCAPTLSPGNQAGPRELNPGGHFSSSYNSLPVPFLGQLRREEGWGWG